MNILIVNDDGMNAKGLAILAKAASNFGTVYATTTKTSQSGSSFSITIKGPLSVDFEDPIPGTVGFISVSGTPLDALKVGLKIFDVDFDLVLTGINHGLNVAYDVNYSGTVALAYEASFNKIFSIAFSADDINANYLYDEVTRLIEEILASNDLQKAEVISVNFPRSSFKTVLGTKYTKLGKRQYHTEFVKVPDTNKYNLTSSTTYYMEDADTDVSAVENGYVSVTPLKNDRTDATILKKLNKG